ncbi:hypothetical protein PCE1_000617 [Barthelona sp. PCE]
MVLIGSRFTMVHIENGELKMSEGKLNFKYVICDGWKHIDLNNYFHDEDCVFYSVDKIPERYGPIKFRAVDNEVVSLNSLQPKRIFFDGIAEVNDDNSSIRCYFFFKERKLIVLRGCKIRSVQPNEGDEFVVFAKVHGCAYSKLCWTGSESKPITTILPHCGSENRGFIQGLPLNVDRGLVYLGEKMIFEFPPNVKVRKVYDSHFDNSACIVCYGAIHFFRFNVNGYDVEVQNHIVFESEYFNFYFNPRPLVETPDHQLFVVHSHSEEAEAETQHLHCLDWSTGSFLEPFLLWKRSYDGTEEGNFFLNFVGDSYIHVWHGIIKAYVEDGAIKTRFFTNNSFPIVNLSQNHNLPNNTIQKVIYEGETKSMVLKTYNVEEDTESMNPTVETFHLPSFLAEASIFEYHMPD